MKNGSHTALLIALAVVLLGSGCKEKATTISLTSRERIRIDTLVKLRVDSLAPILDSLCEADQPGMVERALDSIIRVRKEEEEKIRRRLIQESF